MPAFSSSRVFFCLVFVCLFFCVGAGDRRVHPYVEGEEGGDRRHRHHCGAPDSPSGEGLAGRAQGAGTSAYVDAHFFFPWPDTAILAALVFWVCRNGRAWLKAWKTPRRRYCHQRALSLSVPFIPQVRRLGVGLWWLSYS